MLVSSAVFRPSARRFLATAQPQRTFFGSSFFSSLAAEPEDPEKKEIQSLFYKWNDALATLDSDTVAKRYAKDAVLLPTVSDTPRTDYDSIKDYFDAFLQKTPQGEILESHVKVGEDTASDVGIYEFTLNGTDKVKARYSFVYTKEDDEWKIQHHHSSVMPEGITIATPITKEEVQSLFYLWNDALATKDPDVVASRYAKDAVLLPTVSDVPRTDYDSIKDYFVNFTQLEPQGTILESYVQIGANWAKDSGIYEFTMGATGAVVKARYSFVYVYEDGEWKIAHHHSSQMPEEIEPKRADVQTITDAECRDLFNLWNDALATLDPEKVAARYSKDAILLPTVSDEPRTTKEGITSYFVDFLKKKPQGVIKDGVTVTGENWCKDAGVYEFTMGDTGDKVMARYSYVYVWEDGEWKIAHHHSSVMPEGLMAAAADAGEVLPESEVRGLFNLWNDALATLDPETVAARYSKNAILLPTVSDEPRTSKEAIVDYFTNFLQSKPQGVISDGVILAGEDWAKDAGVYEFTLGATGEKVKARYSFVYVKEDGEWKIAHHHSSAMPEGLMAASGKVKEIEKIVSA